MASSDALTPATPEPSDGRLVEQLAEGSPEALAVLYDRHARLVFATALRLTGDRGAAEEIVQETFLALWNRAELFDAARGSLVGWLQVIARNRSIDHLRGTRRRVPALPLSAFQADGPDGDATLEWLVASGEALAAGRDADAPEDAVTRGETRDAVLAAVDRLDEPERQVILLAYRDGLSQSEIAVRLGWPLGTVKTRTRRSLRRLRRALEAVGGSEADARPAWSPDRDRNRAARPGVETASASNGGPDPDRAALEPQPGAGVPPSAWPARGCLCEVASCS
jgi:RNA polymerase sigma-70 factor (ECF subfamily)